MIPVAAIVVVAAVVAAALVLRSHKPKHTVAGSFTLFDSDRYWRAGQTCLGSGGYGDILSGTSVTISNEKGTVIATSALANGTAVDGTHCLFLINPVTVPDEPFYKFEVSHRGQVTFSKGDLEKNDWKAQLSLGS